MVFKRLFPAVRRGQTYQCGGLALTDAPRDLGRVRRQIAFQRLQHALLVCF